MNGIGEKVKITEANIEEMSRLAEDVMHQLYMNYYAYDAEGQDIFEKYYREEADFKKDISPLIRAEMAVLREDPNCGLLRKLFRRGDNIGDVRYYTLEDIRPWIEPLIPKALHLFRKGTNDCGDTNFMAEESVPDEYLIAAFSREVRNMMMIFAGQKLQREDTPLYLLLVEHPACHDGDEWKGLYFDDENLRKAFESVSSELEENKKNGEDLSLQVGIWEFEPAREIDREADEDKFEGICGYHNRRVKQDIRRVKPEELRCFRNIC